MKSYIQQREATVRSPVVRVLPLQPHCFAFGGFELQMIGAMESARSAGIDIGPLDPWSRHADFDVIHCWGLDAQHLNAVNWARAAQKHIVLSALVGYPTWKALLRRRLPWGRGASEWRTHLLNTVDALTVVSEAQAECLCTMDGVRRECIFVVPNIVADLFLDRWAGLDADRPTDLTDYVLTTGNICPRKNQLALVRACRKIGVPLLLVGDVLTGESAYGDAVDAEIAKADTIRWVRRLPAGSRALAAAYANAKLFALPSYAETQPISALEAVAMGKPVLLANRSYARQEYFANPGLADPKSVESISATLRQMLARPEDFQTPRNVVEACRASAVGAAYAAVYRSVCSCV